MLALYLSDVGSGLNNLLGEDLSNIQLYLDCRAIHDMRDAGGGL